VRIGIFTHYLPGTVEETAKRARSHGFDCVQLNLEFADWRFSATETTRDECHHIREVFHRHGLSIAAIAGYINPVAPNGITRLTNLDRMAGILRLAKDLGSGLVATESGTLNPDDDWAPHPRNDTPAARDMLVDNLQVLLAQAEKHGATLLLEPAVGNVIDTPEKATWLMQAIDSPALGLVADPANFIDGGNIDVATSVLSDMYAKLGSRILLAHAKDFRRVDHQPRERHHHPSDPRLYGGVEYPAAGLGNMDYVRYLRWLDGLATSPPLIVEHLDESDIPRAKAFVDHTLTSIGTIEEHPPK